MARRILGLSLVLAALGVALFLATRGAARGPGTGLRAGEVEADPLPPPAVELPALPEPGLERDAPPLASEPFAPERAASAPAAAEAAGQTTVRLRGTVVVRDPLGVLHAAESGSFALVVWGAELAVHHEVEVRDGAFATDVPADAELGVASLVLGGRRAIYEGRGGPAAEQRFPLPASGVLEILARWPPRMLLHVRAEEDGRELGGVEVVAGGDWHASGLAHPGRPDEGQVLARDARSPVDLSGVEDADGVVYARSPGYAWGRATLDLEQGGERFLALEAGGGLEVELLGERPDDSARLRLRAGDADVPTAEVEVHAELIALESLPARRYRVSVELGEFWAEGPLVLAAGEADVRAGEVQRLTLELAPAPSAELAPLAGTLVIPAAWELEDFTLEAELLDTPLRASLELHNTRSSSLERLTTDTWAFAFPTVQPGRYKLLVPELCFSIAVVVPPGGLTEVVFAAPPPTHVAVRAVEAGSGRDAEILTLHWYAVRPEGVSGGGLESVQRDPESGLFEFTAPQTAIVLHCWQQRYRFVNETVELHDGRNEITLEFSPSCGLVLSILDGESRLPWDSAWMLEPLAAEGPGAATGWTQDGKTLRIMLSEPGLYRFEMPVVPGYEPLPPQEVWVGEGEFVEHPMQLVRLP